MVGCLACQWSAKLLTRFWLCMMSWMVAQSQAGWQQTQNHHLPKDSVWDNFYRSCLEWPSRWRDYFAAGLHSLRFLLSSKGCLRPGGISPHKPSRISLMRRIVHQQQTTEFPDAGLQLKVGHYVRLSFQLEKCSCLCRSNANVFPDY